jgi:selenocysteine lyase/cysteine desulfurase
MPERLIDLLYRAPERIEAREHELLRRALQRWSANERIEILGNPDPARRIRPLAEIERDRQAATTVKVPVTP